MAYLFSRASAVAVAAFACALGACAEDLTTSSDHPEDDLQKVEAAAALPSGEQLALGRAHGCSLDPAISGLLCWGDNQKGQTNVPALLLSPTFVAAGSDVTCAIGALGRVRCWGDNTHRQVAVPSGVGNASQVTVGGAHVCALTRGDRVRCWGDNASGQLTAPALTRVQAIAAGARHTCALANGTVQCWGDNTHGQLDVPELDAPRELAVGGSHSCVLDGDEVVCWGGENPALIDDIPALNAPRALAAGASHSCVIDADGVKCWGDPAATSLVPRELTRPQQIAVGGGGAIAHACVRHLQGVACWGDDSRGQATYDGAPLHLLYHSESEIAAPPEKVWDVLMDLDNYPQWNPYTIAMKSTLKIGDPMVMTVKMNALITLEQTENIRVLEPGHKVCWGIDTTSPNFNSGERCQWLEALPDGGTRYVTEDLIEGTGNPLVTALFGDAVQVGFDGVAAALKTHVESLTP